IEENGNVRRLVQAYEDPATERLMGDFRSFRSTRLASLVEFVLGSGESVLYPEIDDTWIRGAASESEDLERIQRLGIRSSMSVPLVYGGRVLGSLTFLFGRSQRHHTAEALALAKEVAHRSATAVEDVRLHRDRAQR